GKETAARTSSRIARRWKRILDPPLENVALAGDSLQAVSILSECGHHCQVKRNNGVMLFPDPKNRIRTLSDSEFEIALKQRLNPMFCNVLPMLRARVVASSMEFGYSSLGA